MRRLLPPVLALLALLAGSALAQPGPGQPVVEVVKVDGVIDAPMRDYLVGSIEQAERDGATVFIHLDTPGTQGVDALALADRVARARIPVVAWVGPAGARAAGSGVFLLHAAGFAAAAPGAGIGPAAPADLLHEGSGPALPAGAPWLPGGVDALPAEALTVQEALDAGIVDLAGPETATLGDALEAVDGRSVATPGGPVVLATEERSDRHVLTRFHDLGPGRRLLHAVAGPPMIYLLLVLGLALVAFELTQPGIGVAAVAGAAMLGLGGYGLTAAPPWWPGLALLVVGIGAMTLEVRLRRLGVLSIAGIVSFTAGSILVYGGVADAIDLSPWLIGPAVAGSALYWMFGLTVAIQSRERMTSTRRGLVGLVGETRGNLAPEGPVFVKGTLWRGRAMDGPIPPGTRVRVRGVQGLVLEVEPEPE